MQAFLSFFRVKPEGNGKESIKDSELSKQITTQLAILVDQLEAFTQRFSIWPVLIEHKSSEWVYGVTNYQTGGNGEYVSVVISETLGSMPLTLKEAHFVRGSWRNVPIKYLGNVLKASEILLYWGKRAE